MIKRMTLLARRNDLTRDQFSDYWLNHHGEIVKRLPAVAGYVQNLTVDRVTIDSNASEAFCIDGIVELWFENETEQARAFSHPAAKELPIDEPNFIRGITIYPVAESKLTNLAAEVKALLVVRTGQDQDDNETVVPLVAELISKRTGTGAVTVNRLGKAGWRENLWHEPAPPNLILEFGFNSRDALMVFGTSAGLRQCQNDVASCGGAVDCYHVNPRRII